MFGAGLKRKYSREAASLREDETVWATKQRTVSEEKNPLHPSETARARWDPGNPMNPSGQAHINTPKNQEPQEAALGGGNIVQLTQQMAS
jgi:hypothetical protein